MLLPASMRLLPEPGKARLQMIRIIGGAWRGAFVRCRKFYPLKLISRRIIRMLA
jgi:hypothetical protein